MFYKNARIFTSDFKFVNGAFEVVDGKFGAVLPENVPEDAIDLQGATVIPGLIEVHSHGNSGYDFSDGNYDGLVEMAKFYLSCGVTSFAPASMTLPYDVLEKAVATAKKIAGFGLHVQEIDGHDVRAIREAIDNALNTKGVPSCIVLDTIKGKGATFAEPKREHSSQPKEEAWQEAIAASEAALKELMK